MRRYLRHLYWPSLCLLLLAAAGARAATVAEESELKAAFVYNFTLFTTWPQVLQSLRICVLGDAGFVAVAAAAGLDFSFKLRRLAHNVHEGK